MLGDQGEVCKINTEVSSKKDFLVSGIPALRRYLSKNGRLKNADYRRIFGVEWNAAKTELKWLVYEDYLQLQGDRRGAYYVPSPVLPGHERDDKG